MSGCILAGKATSRQIASISRFDSEIANARFISPKAASEGWLPPYPKNTVLREIKLGQETKFVRVHVSKQPQGGFVLTEKQFNKIGNNPEVLRTYLGLKDTPVYVSDVFVPAGKRLTLGRIGPQPSFGLDSVSGFQYELMDQISLSNFRNTRLISDYAPSVRPRR